MRELAKEIIRAQEGERLEAYQDQFGNWTIGVGHLMTKHFYPVISREQMEAIFDADLDVAIYGFERVFDATVKNRPSFTDERKANLVSMIFQMGVNRFARFRQAIYWICRDQWDKAALEILDSLWARQTPRRAVKIALAIRDQEITIPPGVGDKKGGLA